MLVWRAKNGGIPRSPGCSGSLLLPPALVSDLSPLFCGHSCPQTWGKCADWNISYGKVTKRQHGQVAFSDQWSTLWGLTDILSLATWCQSTSLLSPPGGHQGWLHGWCSHMDENTWRTGLAFELSMMSLVESRLNLKGMEGIKPQAVQKAAG